MAAPGAVRHGDLAVVRHRWHGCGMGLVALSRAARASCRGHSGEPPPSVRVPRTGQKTHQTAPVRSCPDSSGSRVGPSPPGRGGSGSGSVAQGTAPPGPVGSVPSGSGGYAAVECDSGTIAAGTATGNQYQVPIVMGAARPLFAGDRVRSPGSSRRDRSGADLVRVRTGRGPLRTSWRSGSTLGAQPRRAPGHGSQGNFPRAVFVGNDGGQSSSEQRLGADRVGTTPDPPII